MWFKVIDISPLFKPWGDILCNRDSREPQEEHDQCGHMKRILFHRAACSTRSRQTLRRPQSRCPAGTINQEFALKTKSLGCLNVNTANRLIWQSFTLKKKTKQKKWSNLLWRIRYCLRPDIYVKCWPFYKKLFSPCRRSSKLSMSGRIKSLNFTLCVQITTSRCLAARATFPRSVPRRFWRPGETCCPSGEESFLCG